MSDAQKATFLAAALICLAVLTGCAGLGPPDLAAGEAESTVTARAGTPTHYYQDGNDRLLEFAKGPFGQQTYMARIGPDGRLRSFEQVLDSAHFARIKPGVTTKDEVLRIIGVPGQTSYLPLRELEVWSYAWREANAWDSMMHVHIDQNGVVQQMMNGPDPHRDPTMRMLGR
jgi:hypothetical protein